MINPPKKITTIQIREAYSIAKDVFVDKTSKSEGRDILIKSVDMNPSSATGYIRVFEKMMHGKQYNRTINQEATRYYFDNILKDFGKEALKKALNATKLHVVYYATNGKGELKGIIKIYKEFLAKL